MLLPPVFRIEKIYCFYLICRTLEVTHARSNAMRRTTSFLFQMTCRRTMTSSSSTAAVIVPSAALQSRSHQLYERLLRPTSTTEYPVSFASELATCVKRGCFSTAEECQMLLWLFHRGVRREDLLEACLWEILKAPYSVPQERKAVKQSNNSLFRSSSATPASQLALETAVSFRIMTELGMKDDPQMISLALGRCIELSEYMTLQAVSEVFRALHALGLQHFTISQTVPSSAGASGGDAPLRPGEPLWRAEAEPVQPLPTSNELLYQPNLIDVLSALLEQRLTQLHRACTPEHLRDNFDAEAEYSTVDVLPNETTFNIPIDVPCTAEVVKNHNQPVPNSATLKRLGDFLYVLRGMSFLGVQDGESLVHLDGLCQSWRPASVRFYVEALNYTCGINARMIDVLHYEDRRAVVQDHRNCFIQHLVEQLTSLKGLLEQLRRDPHSLLQVRKLYENCGFLWEVAPSLWDVARSVHISHRKATKCRTEAMGAGNTTIRKGKLYDPKYAVKLQKITQDYGDCERFIPPQFKTWTNPLTERQRRRRLSVAGTRRFGVQRITKNYVRDKIKKHCPSR